MPKSIPVKINANKQTIQIPKSVSEVGLFILRTLLDKIRSPKINKIKNGIPINKNIHKVNSHLGKMGSCINGG